MSPHSKRKTSVSKKSTSGLTISPPLTRMDDGSPSTSLHNDLRRVLDLMTDERHILAYDLWLETKDRVENFSASPPSPVSQTSPQSSPKSSIRKRKDSVNGSPKKAFWRKNRKEPATSNVESQNLQDFEEAKKLMASKKEDFKRLEKIASLFLRAKQNLTIDDDWMFAQTLFGITTYYRREEDGSLSVKIEGEMQGIPLFEQVAVLREIDLYDTWAPFCNSSLTIAQLDKLDTVGWFMVGLPQFGLSRDVCFRAIGCDSIRENGSFLMFGEGLKDVKEDKRPSSPSSTPPLQRQGSTGLLGVDGSYLKSDPILDELDIPPIPKRIGSGRATLRTFQTIVDVLSPTSARTRIIMNVDPNLHLLPQWLIDFVMKKMAGILLNRLQSGARRMLKDPVRNAHAKKVRENQNFYRGWLLPLFESYHKELGWKLPPVSSFEVSEELLEEEEFYEQELEGKRRRSLDAATVASPTVTATLEEEASIVSESTATTATTFSLQNPLSKYLQAREEKRAQKKARKIAAARKKVARRLKPHAVSNSKLGRLEELKTVKRLAEERKARSSIHDAGSEETTIQEVAMRIDKKWHHHGRPERIWTISAFLLLLFFLLYAPDMGIIKVDVGQASTWMGKFVGESRVIVYLLLCALVHFGLLDAALIYSFCSLELGRKSFSHMKQGYADAARMLSFIISGGIVAGSIIAALLISGLRLASWYSIIHAKSAGEWLGSTEYRWLNSKIGTARDCTFTAGTLTNEHSTAFAIFAVMQNVASTVSDLSGVTFIWNHTVGLALGKICGIMSSLLSYPLMWWNKKIFQVVLESETVRDFPSWHGDALALARSCLGYSAVFFVTALFLANVLIPDKTKTSSSQKTRSTPLSPRQGLNGTRNRIIDVIEEEIAEEEKEEDGDGDVTLPRTPSSASHSASTSGKERRLLTLKERNPP